MCAPPPLRVELTARCHDTAVASRSCRYIISRGNRRAMAAAWIRRAHTRRRCSHTAQRLQRRV